MTKFEVAIVKLITLFFALFSFFPIHLYASDKINKIGKHKLKYHSVTGKFIYAGGLEGTVTYGFQREKKKVIYFRSKLYEDEKKIPYHLYGEDGNPNRKYLNQTFEIHYIKKYEASDEDEELRWVNKIIRIRLIKK